MTNPVKGEVTLELDDGQTFTLVGSFQSRVVAEEAYGKPYPQVVRDAQAEFSGAIRALLYGMLNKHQPDMSLEDVGDLIDAHGEELIAAAAKAMGNAAPDDDGTEDREPKNAPPPRGKRSGRSGAKSD